MHKTGVNDYSGAPGEQVTVTTTIAGSATANFLLNGQPQGSNSPFVFNLPSTPGQSSQLSITLVGAVGDTCTVKIAVVDGGSDVDFMACRSTLPFPVENYHFQALAPQQLGLAATLKGSKGGQ
jgi:hypothetical protein